MKTGTGLAILGICLMISGPLTAYVWVQSNWANHMMPSSGCRECRDRDRPPDPIGVPVQRDWYGTVRGSDSFSKRIGDQDHANSDSVSISVGNAGAWGTNE